MINPNEVEKHLKSSNGNYYLLEISAGTENISNDDFLPAEPGYADAYRYSIYIFREDTKMYESPIFEDTEFKQAVVKRLKEIHSIKDSWDDDPEYFKRKLDKKLKELQEKVNKNIRDSNGNYYQIVLKPGQENITVEDFMPEDPRYPDESRYNIYDGHSINNN